jgi:hypothetical protein
MPPISQWQVYFIPNCRHARPLPKDKFVVVTCFDPNPCGFFINTRVNEFIANHPDLLPCEVAMAATEHPFLAHDSWLDCRELLSFREEELSDLRGVLAARTVVAARRAVQDCPVLRPRFKRLISGE